MASWKQLVDDAPDLAARVRSRFEAAGRHVLATRTLTGSPRVSGTEVGFWQDDVWVGSTSRSGRSMDLLVDPRFVLHSNPGDGSRTDGDVKVDGTVRSAPRDDPDRSAVLAETGGASRSSSSGSTCPGSCSRRSRATRRGSRRGVRVQGCRSWSSGTDAEAGRPRGPWGTDLASGAYGTDRTGLRFDRGRTAVQCCVLLPRNCRVRVP